MESKTDNVTRQAAIGDKGEGHKGKLIFNSYAFEVGFKEFKSFDELDETFMDEALDECEDEGNGGLEIGNLEIILSIDGGRKVLDNIKIDSEMADGPINSWRDFFGKRGLYTLIKDGRTDYADVFFSGEFDPLKLELWTNTAVGGNKPIEILDSAFYDNEQLDLDFDFAEGKGRYRILIDRDRYAWYEGESLSELKWCPIPVEDLMPTPLDFSDWEDWSDEDWNRFAYPLSFHDEKIDEKMKAAFSKTNDLFESGWQEQDEFIFAACRRNIDWTLLVTWEWPTLLKEVDGLVDDKYAVGRIVDWCNHETVRDGYYVVDDCFDGVTLENADGDEDGDVNNWAFLLMLHPELSDRCDSYGKFDGYSACRLIAAQPQLAEKFSFEILGDFKSDCWHSRDEDDFNDAWERLVKTVPQYEKFRKSVKTNK